MDDRFGLAGFLTSLSQRGIRMGELGDERTPEGTHWEIDDEDFAETLRVFKDLLVPVTLI